MLNEERVIPKYIALDPRDLSSRRNHSVARSIYLQRVITVYYYNGVRTRATRVLLIWLFVLFTAPRGKTLRSVGVFFVTTLKAVGAMISLFYASRRVTSIRAAFRSSSAI